MYVYNDMCNCITAKVSAISSGEEWKLGYALYVFTIFDMALQKNVKSRVFWILKKRKKRIVM